MSHTVYLKHGEIVNHDSMVDALLDALDCYSGASSQVEIDGIRIVGPYR